MIGFHQVCKPCLSFTFHKISLSSNFSENSVTCFCSTFRFVLSLVTANVLISSVVAPLLLFETILDHYITVPCISQVVSMISSSIIFSAILSTSLIATDRFYAVTSPLHYSMTITRSRSKIMIVLAWIFGILLASPDILKCLLGNHQNDPTQHHTLHMIFTIFQMVTGYLSPFLLMCYLYLKMYNAAHRNSERTRKHSISGELLTAMDGSTTVIPQGIDFLTHYMNPFTKTPMAGSAHPIATTAGGNQNSTIVSIIPPSSVKKTRRRSSNGSSSSLLFREEGRAIKTAFFVLASFLLCWTPHFVSMLVSLIQEHQAVSQQSTAWMDTSIKDNAISYSGHSWLRFAGLVGMLVSSVLNPFIYVFRNKMAWKEMKKLLCGFLINLKCSKESGVCLVMRDRDAHQPRGRCFSHEEEDDTHHLEEIGDKTNSSGSSDSSNRSATALGVLVVESGSSSSAGSCASSHNGDENNALCPVHHPMGPTKLPVRSSLKSLLTPTSSLNNSTVMTTCETNGGGSNLIIGSVVSDSSHLFSNASVSTGVISRTDMVGGKHPFIRSLTVPEQSQPRVKFPPNLVRQKSCMHRPVYGGAQIKDLTPALSKRSRFVRQDSFCSILSNDSVLMICAEDGLSLGDLATRRDSSSNQFGADFCTLETSRGGSSRNSNGNGAGNGPIMASHKNYSRQDSNFSDASHKTTDSGVVVSISLSMAKPFDSPQITGGTKMTSLHENKTGPKGLVCNCQNASLLQTSM